jgi:hypothetical protein
MAAMNDRSAVAPAVVVGLCLLPGLSIGGCLVSRFNDLRPQGTSA